MKESPVKIVPFQDHHETEVNELMMSIAKEFSDTIFSPPQAKNSGAPALPLEKYWVACSNNQVIGTIAFCLLKNKSIVLKKMFLCKEFRGQGIAKTLLETLIRSASDYDTTTVFLGTMTQFKAAQSFYEKNGFVKIPQTGLPADFPVNPVDSVFYKRQLK